MPSPVLVLLRWGIIKTRTSIKRFWDWCAELRVVDVVIGIGFLGSLSGGEQYLAFLFLVLAGFSGCSKLWHKDYQSRWKWVGTIAILFGSILIVLSTIASTDERPGSNLIVFWRRYVAVDKIPSGKMVKIPTYPSNIEFPKTTFPVPIERRTVKASGVSQPPPVVTSAAYGNLAQRCKELGIEIVAVADRRKEQRPDPAVDLPAYYDWYRLNDGLFHARAYPYPVKIHKELADLHIYDPELDDLLQREEDYFQHRNQPQDVQRAIAHPFMYYPSLEDIRRIGERFQFIATQVPQR